MALGALAEPLPTAARVELLNPASPWKIDALTGVSMYEMYGLLSDSETRYATTITATTTTIREAQRIRLLLRRAFSVDFIDKVWPESSQLVDKV